MSLLQVGHQIIVSYAECMNVPLFRRRIRGSSRFKLLLEIIILFFFVLVGLYSEDLCLQASET